MKLSFSTIIVALTLIGCMKANALKATRLAHPTKNENDQMLCGKNLSWRINGQTLIISGTGEMFNNEFFGRNDAPWAEESFEKVVIEEGVTSIGHHTFNNLPLLKSVEIPNTVITIGKGAFACTSLTSVVIPDSVVLIDNNAFFECGNLTSVTIGKNVKSIGSGAFYSTALLSVSIPDSVKSIGEGSFQDCVGLNNLIIGNSVELIDMYAFYHTNITNVILPEKLRMIGDSAFGKCPLIDVVIPDNVECVQKEAFASCRCLETVVIGESVSSLGDDAFDFCCNLRTLLYKPSHPFSGELFSHCHNVSVNICVPSDFNSTSFGGLNVTNDTMCQRFQSMLLNNCYTPELMDEELVEVKRKNASELERKTNGCVVYRCNNDTEPSITVLCDAEKPFCVNDTCQANSTIEGYGVKVELVLKEGVNVTMINVDEIKSILQNQFGLKTNEFTVGYDINEEGMVLHLILYLNDPNTAKDITTLLKEGCNIH